MATLVRQANARSPQRDKDAAPKRRARGEKRIDLLLEAAELVFAEAGYERATTNLIAARAQCSPGTLYQFFSSKQAIAEAVARRYSEQVEALQREILNPRLHANAEETIDAVADGYLRFLQTAPAYGALFDVVGISPEVSALRSILLDSAIRRIAELIGKYAPGLARRDQLFHAEICVMVFRGIIPMLQTSGIQQRSRAAKEVKVVIKRYLLPIVNGGH